LTASIMPACAKFHETGPIWLLAAFIALAGCTDATENDRFELQQVTANWNSGLLKVRTEQKLLFSNEARDALIHGVPLTLAFDFRLRDNRSQTIAAETVERFEIRYLPLSDHYQLTFLDGTPTRTYPRLRHALADLSSVSFSLVTGALPAGEYEMLVRLRLDQTAMPPPMRLPVLLSSQWQHDSPWSSWPLTIKPGT